MAERPAFRINLVIPEPLQAERLRASARRLPDLGLEITAEPLTAQGLDARVLPVELLPGEEAEAPAPRPPTIYYGPPRALRRAWLSGCADYLREPWDLDELECRLRRLLQRGRAAFTFSWGEAVLGERSFRCPAGEAGLSEPESRILRLLVQQRERVVGREALFYALWGRLPVRGSRVVDVHIGRLRRRLAPLLPEGEGCIQTVRGSGYRFVSR